MSVKRWKQDRFYISTFNAIAGEEHMATQLSYHKETGFNLIEFTFKSPELIAKAMPVCEELGLNTIVQDMSFGGIGVDYPTDPTDEAVRQAVANYGRYPHLLGYYVWDEPCLPTTDLAGKTTAKFRKYDPGRLAFSVMVPSYGVIPWGAKTSEWEDTASREEAPYAKYIKQYIAECDCDVVSVDYYPFAVKRDCSLIVNDLWRDMGAVSYYAKQAGRPFWFYFQGKWDFPADDDTGGIGMTYGRLAAQTFCALAYGAKQLSYFTSSSLVSTTTDARGPLYEEVKLLNHRLMNLGTFLLDKERVAITHSGLEERWLTPYYLDKLTDIPEVLSLPDDLVVSYFTDGSETKYLMVSNKHFDRAVNGEIHLTHPCKASYFNNDTGACVAIGVTDVINLCLEEGDGRVYLLEEEK